MQKLNAILSLLLFCALIAQSQTRTSDPISLLEKSYQKKSLELLNQLLIDWHAVSIPLSDEQISRLSKPAGMAYKVFCLFYELPDYHDTLTSHSYLIVQDQLIYKLVDTLFTLNKYKYLPVRDFHQTVFISDTIFNFRPNIRWKSILFLNDEYKSALENFFSFKSIFQTSKDSLSIAIHTYSEKRAFITSRVKIKESRSYKIFLSNPVVNLIEFNKDLTECVVHFSFNHSGGEAQFRQAPSGWILINHRLTYIE
jgi:hypothetical protein